MNLRAWYDSLFVRAYEPAKQFVSGALAGAGIPRSLAEAKGAVAGLGEMLAGPTPEEQAQGPKPLIDALKQLPQAARENPAGTAGFAMGMAMGGLDPKDLAALKKARGLRKGASIEAEMHVLQEGPPGGVLENVLPTREERGAEMLRQVKLTGEAADPVMSGPQAAASIMETSPALQAVDFGRTVAYAGERWLKTTKGWTRVGGRLSQKDFDWVLKRHFDVTMEQPPQLRGVLPDIIESRPEVAVEAVKNAGGWRDLPTDVEARKIVAKHIRRRITLGQAKTNEIVWLNLHDMKIKQR